MFRFRVLAFAAYATVIATPTVWAQQSDPPKQSSGAQVPATPPPGSPASTSQAPGGGLVFKLGEIVEVIGKSDDVPGIGRVVLKRDQIWTFDRNSLDQAVNVLPGVVSTFDSNGRRNESDIFVRGFGRWQVPLTLDGVRIYLPADNRLDFSRFLTADIAEVQIQKGYASVLDGPGAMGGAINLVTRKPAKGFEAEGSAQVGGRDGEEGWNAYAMMGTRQEKYYLQGSANFADRDFWTMSGNYQATANSLQMGTRRISSDTADSRLNFKAGFTPNDADEYTFNYISQSGEKGAPLHVYNNPLVPANSFWRWPYWDLQNTSFLSNTRLGKTAYFKSKLYYNTFKNGLDAYDDITYTTQSANGRFSSPYDDHAYGISVEAGTERSANTLKAAVHYRADFHTEQQENRPTNPNPALHTIEPKQEQAQTTWSVALEDTFHATPQLDLVGGISFDQYKITKAEEFSVAQGLFEFPKGGSDAFNWQTALIWRYRPRMQMHASVSDRARFPVIFELYSTRFGAATPNPDLGPERATNVELGWKTDAIRDVHFEAALFYSDVRDLIQTVVLPDATTQTQNVGNGRFYGAEVAGDARLATWLRIGANYTFISRTVTDALLPNLQTTGVPDHKAFVYATWQPIRRLRVTPSIDVAGDRWSDRVTSPVQAVPYIRTGKYTLVNLAAEYEIARGLLAVFGFKNLTDDYYELSWGLPQAGRTFYFKTRFVF